MADDSILAILDSNPREAERKWNLLNQKLIFYFQHHYCSDAEDCAQDVFHRVLKKLPPSVVTHEDLKKFCFGVARNIVKERRREPTDDPLPDDIDRRRRFSRGLNAEEQVLEEERNGLIQEGLLALAPEDLELLVAWYQEGRKSHSGLAQKLGITANALRIKVFRSSQRAREQLRARGL